jgi:BMFP domain-containing protein YqiC
LIKPDPKIFDDLSRVAGGAMNVFSAFREQILNDIKTRVDEAASRMDLVPREDFERLETQVKALQKKIDAMEGKKPAAAPKKAPAKKKPVQGKNKGKKKS